MFLYQQIIFIIILFNSLYLFILSFLIKFILIFIITFNFILSLFDLIFIMYLQNSFMSHLSILILNHYIH